MDKFYFLIGGIHVELQCRFPLIIQNNLRPFLTEKGTNSPTDILYTIAKAPAPGWKPEGLGAPIFEKPFFRIYRTGNALIQADGLDGCEDYIIVRKDKVWGVHVYILTSPLTNQYYNVSNSMGFPFLLPYFDGFFLHAAFIRWQGKGILFSAPSGTGKSTQAALWERLRGADILNGDKALLRYIKQEKRWRAFGSPWAGSSHIYRKESAPLHALVILRQAPQNSICRMERFPAYKQLFSQSSAPLFDAALLGKTTDLLERLVNDTPVFLLQCRPDEDAVKILENALLHL